MLLCHFLLVFVTVSVLSDGIVAEQVSNEQEIWAKIDDNNPNKLYKVFIDEGGMEFVDAEEKCRGSMATLASFHTLEELNFINNLVQQAAQSSSITGEDAAFWLGLYHIREPVIGLPNYKLYFTDGTSYDLPHDTNNHSLVWAAIGHQPERYEPNGFKNQANDAEYCVESEFSHVANGDVQRRLNDVICHKENKMYVCQRGFNNSEVVELPSEVVNGEISQRKRMRSTQTTTLATKSPLTNTTLSPQTTLSTSFKTKITSKSTPLKNGTLTCPLSQNRGTGDTFYFVLFLIASVVLLGETAYIFYLHKKNPGLNSFTFQNF
ncbi:lectin c-type domain-containing protein [Ditylenchus destructor]|uniref:Lectin c-type domain-containing protein n=1 Tax=Ditylenchus destructor TaxID=166010 RepID=A0AAD4R578_9BILA|nr:lectin c-type domain-containing protein [Ditylenchus destructor]